MTGSKSVSTVGSMHVQLPVGDVYSPEELVRVCEVELTTSADISQIEFASVYVTECETKEREAVESHEIIEKRRRQRPRSNEILFCESHSRLRCSSCKRQREQNKKQWHVVPRCQQLYEGNLQDWLAMMGNMLRRLGIWGNAQASSRKALPNFRYDEARRFAIDDSWAVSIMLMHVNPYLLTRLRIDPALSSCELLSKLASAARPFRFADLPVELRVRICGYMVPVGEEYDEMTRAYREEDQVVSGASSSKYWRSLPRRLATIRHLCAVSLEFREEVSKIHYSCNTFVSRIDDGTGEDTIEIWANTVSRIRCGMWPATSLQDSGSSRL